MTEVARENGRGRGGEREEGREGGREGESEGEGESSGYFGPSSTLLTDGWKQCFFFPVKIGKPSVKKIKKSVREKK